MRCMCVCVCAPYKTKRNERFDDIISSRIIFQVDCFSYDCFHVWVLARSRARQTTPDFRCIHTEFNVLLFNVCSVCFSFGFVPRSAAPSHRPILECASNETWTTTTHNTRKTKAHQSNNFVIQTMEISNDERRRKQLVIMHTSSRKCAQCVYYGWKLKHFETTMEMKEERERETFCKFIMLWHKIQSAIFIGFAQSSRVSAKFQMQL